MHMFLQNGHMSLETVQLDNDVVSKLSGLKWSTPASETTDPVNVSIHTATYLQSQTELRLFRKEEVRWRPRN